MSAPNLHTVTPREARRLLEIVIQTDLVPMLESSPGMGKSSIIKQIAKDYNLFLIDHRLSTSEPTDMTGLPKLHDTHAEFVPFEDIFPTEDTPIPEGYDGFLLFLDEFPSMQKAVQAASFKLILDKMVGQKRLHPNTKIMTAGNKATDRAIVNPITTAMQSRLVHLTMEVSHREWLEDVAFKHNYDSRIIAFLSQFPSKLMDFRPDHNEKTFACPRTWEFMNELVYGREVTDKDAPLYAGTITSGVAVEFINFCKIYKDLITVDEIVLNPEGAKIPDSASLRWATVSHMLERITEDNLGKLATYVDRYSMDFRILFYRSIAHRQPFLKRHEAFVKAMIELNDYIYG